MGKNLTFMQNTLPPINNKRLLQLALTHRSYLNEHPETNEDNERLEFLGDAVLGFLVGELLYLKYPHMSEAEMTRLRSLLVDEQQLAYVAGELSLGKFLRMGRGAEKDGGRNNPSILSDAFEAIVAAYFLQSGIEAVREYLQPLFISIAESIVVTGDSESPPNLIDCKNRFQQWALSHFGENPKYRIVDESGPDHAKEFTAEVIVKGRIYGVGKGRRKQEAEKSAAEEAIKKLRLT